jgi:hypothetical protein
MNAHMAQGLTADRGIAVLEIRDTPRAIGVVSKLSPGFTP